MIREREGCDVIQELGERWPTDRPGYSRFSITCSRCSGTEHDCAVCFGSGEERIFACPGVLLDRDASELLRAFSAYESGHLPDEGGMDDQAAPFVDLVHVVGAEVARIHAEDIKAAKSRAKPGAPKPKGKAPNRI